MRIKKNIPIYSILFVSLFILPAKAMAYRMGDFEVLPFFSGAGKYDTNVLQTNTGRIRDYATDLTAAVSVTHESKQQMFGLTGSLSEEIYARERSLNNTSENIDLSYARQFDRNTTFNAANTFNHTDTPTNFADQFGRTSGRYQYFLNRFGMGYGFDVSRQFSVAANYASEIYDPALRGLASSLQNAISLRGDYVVTSTTSLVGVYGFSRRSFDPGGKVTANTFDGGVREYFSSKTYVDLLGGASASSGVDGKRSTTPRYEATLSHEITGKTRASASLTWRTDTNYSSSDLFRSSRASVSLSHRFYSRLSGGAELFHGQGKYTDLGIQDKFNGASGNVEYALTPDADIFGSSTYSRTSSNLASRAYARAIVSFFTNIASGESGDQ